MAGYLILIYGDEQKWDRETEDEQRFKDEAHRSFVAQAGAGAVRGGALEASGTATSLRLGPAGRPLVTDGPFLESKEAIGGFYLLDAPDLDEAIRLASLLPELRMPYCAVEIRPLVGQ